MSNFLGAYNDKQMHYKKVAMAVRSHSKACDKGNFSFSKDYPKAATLPQLNAVPSALQY